MVVVIVGSGKDGSHAHVASTSHGDSVIRGARIDHGEPSFEGFVHRIIDFVRKKRRQARHIRLGGEGISAGEEGAITAIGLPHLMILHLVRMEDVPLTVQVRDRLQQIGGESTIRIGKAIAPQIVFLKEDGDLGEESVGGSEIPISGIAPSDVLLRTILQSDNRVGFLSCITRRHGVKIERRGHESARDGLQLLRITEGHIVAMHLLDARQPPLGDDDA